MSSIKETLVKLADFLVDDDKHMSGSEVADYLNRNGHKTSYGEEYKGGRGTFRAIKCVQQSLEKEGRFDDAENVAKAFTKQNDDYAYEQY